MKRTLLGIGVVVALGVAATGCNEDRTLANDNRTSTGDDRNLTKDETAYGSQMQTMVIPANTSIVATLDKRISTETGRTGDTFTLTTTDKIVSDGRTVFPAGAAINGQLRDVESSGRVSGRAQMTLAFNSVTASDGRVHAMNAVPLILQAESGTGTDIERMAAGGIIGAAVGGIAGGGKGAAIGAGTGVGAGVIVMLATKGDELVLESGQKVSVTFTQPLSIQVAGRN